MYQLNNVDCGESVLKYLADHIHILAYISYKSTTWFFYIHGIRKGNTTYTNCAETVLLIVYDTDYQKIVPAQNQKLSLIQQVWEEQVTLFPLIRHRPHRK
jgi:hypothetical protein